MNKNAVIGGIVVAILVVWGIWYFTSTNNSPAGPQAVTTTPADTTNPNTKPAVKPLGTNTFRSIFTQSGNHECLYEQVTSTGRSSSVVYLADGKMRGEFRTTSNGVSSADIMIYNGGILYSWKEGATTGKKSSIKSMADLPDAIPGDLTSGASFGVNFNSVSWDCHNWAKDPKILVIPTYVKF